MLTLYFQSQAVRPMPNYGCDSIWPRSDLLCFERGVQYEMDLSASFCSHSSTFVSRKDQNKIWHFSFKFNSALVAGLMYTHSGWFSPQPLQVLEGENPAAGRTKEWNGNVKCRAREPLLSPESHLCMHGHSCLLNAKLIVIPFLPEMIWKPLETSVETWNGIICLVLHSNLGANQ